MERYGQRDARPYKLNLYFEFSDQAAAMLSSLNDFDSAKVLDEILFILSNPRQDVKMHWRDSQNRFIKSQYPFGRYHYLINYYALPDGRFAILDILFDDDLCGRQGDEANERTMLYNVTRGNGMKYDRPMPADMIEQLPGAWDVGDPVTSVTTDYAAVNGMLNDLDKAGWLMGVHLDNAYRTANPNEFTLCHNPTERGGVDLAECIWDKSPSAPTHNAGFLSAVLRQQQESGRKTKWLVHSQGAIIFHSAVKHHIERYNTPLSNDTVAIHGSGANVDKMKGYLRQAGIEIKHVRNNPFDLVPNVAGSNNLSSSGLYRALQFMFQIGGSNGGNCAISPHTLPFLGVRSYEQQLLMAGKTKKAKQVRTFMKHRERERALGRKKWG